MLFAEIHTPLNLEKFHYTSTPKLEGKPILILKHLSIFSGWNTLLTGPAP